MQKKKSKTITIDAVRYLLDPIYFIKKNVEIIKTAFK